MRYLNIKSYYSFLSSTLSIDDIVEFAIKNKFDSIALTDDSSMCGCLEFINKCKKNNIKPIVGMEIYVDAMEEREKYIVIASSSKGYNSLMYLTSLVSYTDKSRSIDLTTLINNSDDLIVIVPSSRSYFSVISLHNEIDGLKEYEEKLKDIKNLYLGLEVYSKEDIKINEFLRRNSSLKRVAINEALAINNEEETLRILEAIKKNDLYKNITTSYKELYLKKEMELASYFTVEELDESNKIASMVKEYEFDRNPHVIKYETKNNNSKEYLYHLSLAGLKKRLNNMVNDVYLNRLNEELKIIDKMGYNDYFLVVYDYVKWAKKNDIMVGPGRGSGAGSLVSYVLGIVDVDPIKYNLYFERFLNPQRITMPDIDIDFEDTRRDEVVAYLREKYGYDRVGNVITYQTMAMKQALRDVCRVLGVNETTMNTISKKIPHVKGVSLSNVCEVSKDFKDFIYSHKEYKRIFDIASKIEGFPRQSGEHAAGIVICNDSLYKYVPVLNDGSSIISQYDKDYLEELGLFKMDILSLKNLTIIHDCIKQINDMDKNFSIKDIDIEDSKIYEMLNKNLVAGLFQLESSGMRDTLLKVKPSCFEDISSIIALFRPGPMAMIGEFAKRKNNKEEIVYFSDSVKDILSYTYGIIVYQEQVMQIASRMAGFSLGKADILRRAMSKKDRSKLESLKKEFIDGGLKLNYSKELLEEVFAMLEKFASYGFNRSHSISYAMIGMQMAYLKCYYPNIFFANLMNTFASSSMDSKFFEYVEEAKKFNVKLLSPSVNARYMGFYNDGDDIRFALNGIKGINTNVISSIIEENSKEKFSSYVDAVVRLTLLKIRKDNIITLIEAGAFDEFEHSRSTMIANLDEIINYSKIVNVSVKDEVRVDYSMGSAPIIRKINEPDNLEKEKYLLGIFVSSFPLEKKRDYLTKNGYVMVKDLEKYINKSVKMALFIRKIKTMRDKNGNLMSIILTSDESGNVDLTLFASDYEKYHNEFEIGKCVYVQGKVQKRTIFSLIVNGAKRIED